MADHVDSMPHIPPTVPAHSLSAKVRSKWPSVLGVLCIVFGALAALAGCFCVLSALFFHGFYTSFPNPITGGTLEFFVSEIAAGHEGQVLVRSLATVALAVIQLVAGGGLFKRRRWAFNVVWFWAILKVLLLISDLVLESHIAPLPPPNVTPTTIYVNASIVLDGLLIGLAWALPVFMMIWLSRGKIREETAAWGYVRPAPSLGTD